MPKASKPRKPTKPQTGTQRRAEKRASVAQLASATRSFVKKHLHANRTRGEYDGYEGRFSDWLLGMYQGQVEGTLNDVEVQHMAGLGLGPEQPDEGGNQEELTATAAEWLNCLDRPSKVTPELIQLYITQKCIVEGFGSATAWGIYSALKKHYELIPGEKYSGKWELRDGEWVGNPCTKAVLDLVHSVSHREQADGKVRDHSLPMTIECLGRFLKWSEESLDDVANGTEADHQFALAQHKMLKAASTLAWTILGRIFEIAKIQRKDIIGDLHGPAPHRFAYTSVKLVNRKGWTRKVKRGGGAASSDDLEGHTFNLYEHSEEDIAEAFKCLWEWIEYLEARLGRPLEPDDYIFPLINKGGINPSVPMNEEFVLRSLNAWASEDEEITKLAGKFTTHCFRRGGAQYRFMFAPLGHRWTLKKLRWWGGWAEKEHHDTIIKYLLDELENYTEGFTDALQPIPDRREGSFMGEHRFTERPTAQDITALSATVQVFMKECLDLMAALRIHQKELADARALIAQLQQPTAFTTASRTAAQPRPATSTTSTATPMNTIPTRSPNDAAPGPSSQPAASPAPRIPAQVFVPPPPRPNDGPDPAFAWVVRDWKEADPKRGLTKALKDFTKEEQRKDASKYNQRRLVALTFIEDFGEDRDEFLRVYPEADGARATYKALVTAIQKRSDRCAGRISRKQREAE